MRKKANAVPIEARDPTLALAHEALEVIEGKKAEDIVLLDVREVATFTDYFIVCSAGSERQLKAIVESAQQFFRARRKRAVASEGQAESGWVLLDAGSIIVHVFTPEVRAFYALEELWRDAPRLVKIQ